MVRGNIRQLPNLTLTSEEISLLESTLDKTSDLEDITLIFPWGLSPISPKRSSNYLAYCLDLPPQAMHLAILRLLGLRPYHHKWWTQKGTCRRLYLRTRLVESMKRTVRRPTGTVYTTNT